MEVHWITEKRDLDALPTGSVIACEIAEYTGLYALTNTDPCCSGWHDEVNDDFTPELPAIVIERPEVVAG
jgi:hypothetical protein